MRMRNKDRIRVLLKSIETGDPAGVAVVDEARYIQHDPQPHQGSEDLAALFARLAKTNPHFSVVRAFWDGGFAFARTEYEFATRRIGFEILQHDRPERAFALAGTNERHGRRFEEWREVEPLPPHLLHDVGSVVHGRDHVLREYLKATETCPPRS